MLRNESELDVHVYEINVLYVYFGSILKRGPIILGLEYIND